MNADGAVVSRNQVLRTPSARTGVGTAILVGGRTVGLQVDRNTISGGDRNGITVSNAFGVGNAGIVVDRNQVVGRANGIRFVDQTSGMIGRNTVTGGSGTGILLEGMNSGIALDRNTSVRNRTVDCADQSTGTGTAGTANVWTRNVGLTSAPPRLCSPF